MKRLFSLKCAAVLCSGAAAAFSLWFLALPANSSPDAGLTRSRAVTKAKSVEAAAHGPGRHVSETTRDSRGQSRMAGKILSKWTTAGHIAAPRESADAGHGLPLLAEAGAPYRDSAGILQGTGAAGIGKISGPVAKLLPPVLPLVFQEEEPGTLFTGPAHGAAVAEVQDQFIEDIGGETADPSTHEYRKRWPSAQRISDLRLRARIGAQAFAGYQRRAHEHAAGQGTQP